MSRPPRRVRAAVVARRRPRRPAAPLAVGLGVLLALVVPAALGFGAVTIAPRELAAIIAAPLGLDVVGASVTPQQTAVLLAIRLPRTLLGLLAGGTLGVCGAAMQALFRNPLADPALVGTASGAALGAATAIVLLPALPFVVSGWLAGAALPLAAFAGGAAVTALVHRLAMREGTTPVAALLLAGIAFNALAGAATGLLTFLADDAQLRRLVFWNLGSLGGATWPALAAAAPGLLLALIALPARAGACNALLLGEREATHLGIDVDRLTRRIVLLVALGIGAAVALCGVIGFVGLVVPHLLRGRVGHHPSRLLVPSFLGGALLTTLADVTIRVMPPGPELKLGVVTALVGAPFFLKLIMHSRAPVIA